MTNIRELANNTGFSRDAIRRRVKTFNLPDQFDARDVLQLLPLDEKQANAMSLEEARTADTIQATELKRIQREKLEGELANVDEMLADEASMIDGIAAILYSSPLDEERKQDIAKLISDHRKKWQKK